MIKGLNEKLQKFRKQYGLSQKDVANAINVSPSIISGYETRERNLSQNHDAAVTVLSEIDSSFP